tara:strand:+ start:792 stop:1373 length:582 start_codon:yes stop_codon:yes gene_type:complete
MKLDKLTLSGGDIEALALPSTSPTDPGALRVEYGNIQAFRDSQGWEPIPVVLGFDPESDAPVGVYEAEDAHRLEGGNVTNNHSGYTGSGFFDYTATRDAYVEWQVPSLAAGPFDLTFRYAIDNRAQDLYINGVKVKRVPLSNYSSSALQWTTETHRVNLEIGTNTIRLQATGSSGPNLDHMQISAVDGAVYET